MAVHRYAKNPTEVNKQAVLKWCPHEFIDGDILNHFVIDPALLKVL